MKDRNTKQVDVKLTGITFYHIIIPLLIMFVGLWAMTQRFAQLTDYDFSLLQASVFSLGDYPVYAPWSIVQWTIKILPYWKIYTPIYKEALTLFSIYFTIGLLLFIILSLTRGKNTIDGIYGTAKWGTVKDLKAYGLLAEKGIVLGETEDAHIKTDSSTGDTRYKLKKPGKLIISPGRVHSLVVAPSRSGKGINTIIPTLLSWPGSCIVFDPKGENFNTTAGNRKSFSHILRFAPLSTESIRFNPLMEVRPQYIFSDVNNIVDILMTPTSAHKDENSTHFTEAAKDFLTGVILHVLSCPQYTDKSLSGVLKFLSSISADDDGKSLVESMINSSHIEIKIHEQIVRCANRLLLKKDKERSGVFSTACRFLQIFEDPMITINTSMSDFNIDDFLNIDKPISLYLTVPYSHIDRIAPLIRLFIMFFIRRFTEGETQFGKELKNRCLFLLDEFPVLGSFPYLEKTMGVLAGFGITFLLVCQSLQQLNQLYGANHSFLEHCKISTTFATGDLNSAKLFSEVAGKKSVLKESTSSSGEKKKLGLSSINVSGSEVQVNLIDPYEIMQLRPEEIIIFQHGMPPYRGKKVIYYNDKRFNKIANLSVPVTYADMLKECPIIHEEGTGLDLYGWNKKYSEDDLEKLAEALGLLPIENVDLCFPQNEIGKTVNRENLNTNAGGL